MSGHISSGQVWLSQIKSDEVKLGYMSVVVKLGPAESEYVKLGQVRSCKFS